MWTLINQPLLFCYFFWAAAFPPEPVVKVLHPIHVCTSNIEYNKQEGKLEVICSIFTDDFELALTKQYRGKMDLIKPEMHKEMETLVRSYVMSNLQLKTGVAPLTLNYLGFEINKEATEIYFETDKIPVVKKIEVNVSLLHNLYDDQINIVHVTINGVRKSEKLDYPDKKLTQVF